MGEPRDIFAIFVKYIAFVVFLFLLGVALYWCWTRPMTLWEKLPLAPLATMAVGALAACVTTSAVDTWNTRRRKESLLRIAAHREDVYERVLLQIIESEHLRRPGQAVDEHAQEVRARAAAATWAHADVISALEEWDRTRGQDGSAGRKSLESLISVMRKDLRGELDSGASIPEGAATRMVFGTGKG